MAQQKKRKRKRRHPGRVFLISLLFAALFIACIYGAYHFIADSSPYINASPTPAVQPAVTPTPSVRPSPSAKPSATPRARGSENTEDEEEDYGRTPERTPEADEVSFLTYENSLYGFDCPYPGSFVNDGAEEGDIQFSLRSSDGGAYQHIIADDSPADTPAMDMRAFLSEHPSAIIEENRSGNDYFYILINDNGMYIYRYEAYSDGSAKGFEFGYPESAADQYAEYPDFIRADFMLY